MTKKKDKLDLLKAIKVLVTPWKLGFTCGISMDTRAKMTTEEYELCSTIARGMIKMATTDPHSTFLWGLRGFADDAELATSSLDGYGPCCLHHAARMLFKKRLEACPLTIGEAVAFV